MVGSGFQAALGTGQPPRERPLLQSCAWIQRVAPRAGDHETVLAQGGRYAALFGQECGDGLVEARCAAGLRLSDGRVFEPSDLNRGPRTVERRSAACARKMKRSRR